MSANKKVLFYGPIKECSIYANVFCQPIRSTWLKLPVFSFNSLVVEVGGSWRFEFYNRSRTIWLKILTLTHPTGQPYLFILHSPNASIVFSSFRLLPSFWRRI